MSRLQQLPNPGKAKPLQIVNIADFNGGLNLKDDRFEIAPNETPDCSNVDFDQSGGVQLRGSVRHVATTPHFGHTAALSRMWPRTLITSLNPPYPTPVSTIVVGGTPQADGGTDPGAETIPHLQRLMMGPSYPSAWSPVSGTGPRLFNAIPQVWSIAPVHLRSAVLGNSTYVIVGVGARQSDITGAGAFGVTGHGPWWSGSSTSANQFNKPPRWRLDRNASGVTALDPPSPNLAPTYVQYGAAGNDALPMGSTIAAHAGMLWMGNIQDADVGNVADGVRFWNTTFQHSRVRFSHPNQPTKWRANDWIDIEPDSDGIMAMVSFRDHLVIFKRSSIHAIYGYDPDTFQVVNIARGIGSVGQESVTVGPDGVYFYDERRGAFRYNGQTIDWLFEKLDAIPAQVNAAQIVPSNGMIGKATMTFGGAGRGRVYLSLPLNDATENNATFVFDPITGAWTRYDMGFLCLTTYKPSDGVDNVIGLIATTSGGDAAVHLALVDQAEPTDCFDGVNEIHIDGHYVTPWIHLGEPVVKKSWKRPEVIVNTEGKECDFVIESYKDYNYEAPDKVQIMHVEDGVVEGDSIEKLTSLGTARAVSLKIVGPADQDVRWSINDVSVKARPKAVRS